MLNAKIIVDFGQSDMDDLDRSRGDYLRSGRQHRQFQSVVTMLNRPSSLCEMIPLVINWPYATEHAAKLDDFAGRTVEPPSIMQFRDEFAAAVQRLTGEKKSLPLGLSLGEAKTEAVQLLQRLICQSEEVLPGWKDAFTTIIPGDVRMPARPVRSAADVLTFMDNAKLSSPRPAFGMDVSIWQANAIWSLHHGIKCGLLWLIAQKLEEPNCIKREFPDDIAGSQALFASVRDAVERTLPAEPEATGKASNWPEGMGWEFRAGQGAFRGKSFVITGKNLLALKKLAQKPGEPVSKEALLDLLDPEHVAPNCVNDALSEVRKILQKTFRLESDPIPVTKKPTSWKLVESIFPKFSESKINPR